MKKKIAIIVAIVALGSLSAAYAWKGRGADRLVASGTLEARNISVGSKVGGRITEVLVHEGDSAQTLKELGQLSRSGLHRRPTRV